jgi:hypothetical protein
MATKKLQLEKVGRFNDIPEEFIPEPLKPGQIVVYQLLNGQKNPLPVGDPDRKQDVYYGSVVTIPTRDRIKLNNELIDIGVVKEKKDGEVTRVEKYFFPADKYGGKFTITEGNIKDEMFYQFFELSNYNKSNPNRDKSVEALYERIDPLREAKEINKRGLALGEATQYVSNMTTGAIRKLSAALNMDSLGDPEVLRAELMRRAIENPTEFIRLIDDPETKMKALVKRGLEYGVIGFHPVEYKFTWANGSTIAKLDREEGKDELDAMADWLKTHVNGPKVAEKVEQLVQAELKKRSKEGPDEESTNTK